MRRLPGDHAYRIAPDRTTGGGRTWPSQAEYCDGSALPPHARATADGSPEHRACSVQGDRGMPALNWRRKGSWRPPQPWEEAADAFHQAGPSNGSGGCRFGNGLTSPASLSPLKDAGRLASDHRPATSCGAPPRLLLGWRDGCIWGEMEIAPQRLPDAGFRLAAMAGTSCRRQPRSGPGASIGVEQSASAIGYLVRWTGGVPSITGHCQVCGSRRRCHIPRQPADRIDVGPDAGPACLRGEAMHPVPGLFRAARTGCEGSVRMDVAIADDAGGDE